MATKSLRQAKNQYYRLRDSVKNEMSELNKKYSEGNMTPNDYKKQKERLESRLQRVSKASESTIGKIKSYLDKHKKYDDYFQTYPDSYPDIQRSYNAEIGVPKKTYSLLNPSTETDKYGRVTKYSGRDVYEMMLKRGKNPMPYGEFDTAAVGLSVS